MELDQELLTKVVVGVMAVLAPLAALVVGLFLTKYAAKWARDVAFYVRRYEPQIVAAVNEPTDAIPSHIDSLLDRVRPGEWDKLAAQALPAFYRAFADALDAQFNEAVPLQERAEDATK